MNTLKEFGKTCPFLIGQENTAYEQYFEGRSYLQPLSSKQIDIVNVTFEPDCRNHWHIHHGGGQILLCSASHGYYQEWGKEIIELHVGDVVNIPPEVKHWHGAAKDTWFSHIAITVPCENNSCEWLEIVEKDNKSE